MVKTSWLPVVFNRFLQKAVIFNDLMFLNNMKKNSKASASDEKIRYEILKKSFPVVMDSVSVRELKKSIKYYVRHGKEGFFPIGQTGSYLFSYLSFSMLYLERNIEAITGIPEQDLLTKPIYESFSRIIIPEHVYAVARLAETAFGFLCSHANDDVVINSEYNIITPGRANKRLLFQYRAVSRNGSGIPVMTFGHLTDFTHIVAGGPPRTSVLINGQLEGIYAASPEEILAGIEIPLTQKELSVLLLKQKGYRTKEIATMMRMKELSIYSIIRDIKRKTGLDIPPLIRQLQEKGAVHSG